MRFALLVLSALLVAAPRPARAQGPHFQMSRVADGVYAAVFDNPLEPAVDGTAVVIVNDADVLVVDTQNTPATARDVLAAIRKITHKPVRYVVNTHWHGDHVDGNQVYEAAFPGVDFIAHPNTREDLIADTASTTQFVRKQLPEIITGMERRLSAGTRPDGTPLSDGDRVALRRELALHRWLLPRVREMHPVLPTMTISDSLVLHRTVHGAERTIVVRYLGRGNTRGDLIVYLPRERVVATGDLLVNPVPYAFGSYLGDWVKALKTIRSIPADVIIPGHGAIQHDRGYLDLVISLLESTLEQTRQAAAKGMDLAATRKAIRLDSLRARFVGSDPARDAAFTGYFVAPAVERAWQEARGELR